MCSSIAEVSGEPWYQVENAVLTAHLYLKSLGKLFSGILYLMFVSLPMAAVGDWIIFKVQTLVSFYDSLYQDFARCFVHLTSVSEESFYCL